MKQITKKQWLFVLIAVVVVFVITALLRVPITFEGLNVGYWTLGDVAVYVSAAALGGPLGALAAALGSALADLVTANFIYIPASIIIKGGIAWLMAIFLKKEDRSWLRLVRVTAICGVVMMLAYFLYSLFTRGFLLAAYGLPFDLLQALAAVILGTVVLKLISRKTAEQGKLPAPEDPFENVFPTDFSSKRKLK